MAKLGITFSDVVSAIYLVIMIPFVGLLLLADLLSVLNTGVILTSGFSNTSVMHVVGLCTFFISPSFIIPGLRRMYYRLPWLEPFIKYLLIDSTILCLGYEILNFGFQVVDPGRHTLFIGLAVAWLIGARLVQCTIMTKRPIQFAGVSE